MSAACARLPQTQQSLLFPNAQSTIDPHGPHARPAKSAPGKPEDSLLYTMVERGLMPKSGPKLSAEKIELIKNYIENLSP